MGNRIKGGGGAAGLQDCSRARTRCAASGWHSRGWGVKGAGQRQQGALGRLCSEHAQAAREKLGHFTISLDSVGTPSGTHPFHRPAVTKWNSLHSRNDLFPAVSFQFRGDTCWCGGGGSEVHAGLRQKKKKDREKGIVWTSCSLNHCYGLKLRSIFLGTTCKQSNQLYSHTKQQNSS